MLLALPRRRPLSQGLQSYRRSAIRQTLWPARPAL
jgi:hypothetical protein